MTNRFNIIFLLSIIVVSFTHGQEIPPVCAESTTKYGVKGYNDSEFVWSVEGGNIISGEGTDTIEVMWGYKTGKYDLEVLEYTKEGCFNVPSQTKIEVKAPWVSLGPDFMEFCDGDSIVLDAYIEYDTTYEYEWFNGLRNNPNYVVKQSEEIWVKVTADDGCTRYDTIQVQRNLLPYVNLGPDTVVCNLETEDRRDEEMYEIDLGNIGIDYVWSSTLYDEENQPAYSNDSRNKILASDQFLDTISVIVTDEKMCVNYDTVLILPCNILEMFKGKYTNAISPDDDGVNDVWNIKYMDLFPNAVLEIFDRQGRLVYRTENVMEEPWDGKSKGKALPMDAYYFILELNHLNAEPLVGTINIIK